MNKALIMALAILFASCSNQQQDTTELDRCTFTIEMEYVDGATLTEKVELPSDIRFAILTGNGVYTLYGKSNQCFLCSGMFYRKPGVLRYKIIKKECK